MQAGDVTLKSLFSDNHRYEIPMFQRPYVWGAEHEWAPLWEDISAAADGVVADMLAGVWPEEPPRYFLGSIVVKGTPRHPQRLGGSIMVDGQQRLTTLQVMLAAARAVAAEVGADSAVGRFGAWIDNDAAALHENFPDDRYKLWPLPQDREEYLWAVRGLDDDVECPDEDHQVARARVWFEDAIRTWAGDDEMAPDRLDSLHSALKDRMQVALVTLEKTDNAQVIFEALNHRGVELSQSDLIKNLLFRLVEEDPGQRHLAESLLVDHWLPLDSREWREDVTTGRIQRNRLDLVLAYWLTIQTEDVVSVERLFDEFKDWMLSGDHDAVQIIKAIRRHADLYERLITSPPDEPTAELVDHVVATKTNTVWPLLLSLFAEDFKVPERQRVSAVSAIGSYLMRRGICGLTTKDYNRIFVSVIKTAQGAESSEAGDAIENSLAALSGESRMWPDDGEFIGSLIGSNFYGLSKPRLRAFFAGIENHLRDDQAEEAGRVRAESAQLNIEHVMPQSWHEHWPLPGVDDHDKELERREGSINTVGNLTLTNGKLNSKMQHADWATKRSALQAKSTMIITTASILSVPDHPSSRPISTDAWDETRIDHRSTYLIARALETWPRPKLGADDQDRWAEPVDNGVVEDHDDDEGELNDDEDGD